MDVGQVVNEKTARSQIIGGVTFGIGMALLEKSQLEEKTGRYANANFAEYLVATNADVPLVDVHFIDKPDTIFNPLGCARNRRDRHYRDSGGDRQTLSITLPGKGCGSFQFCRNEFCLWNWNDQRSARNNFVRMAWKELKQIINEYQRSDGPFALATLVHASGSTYRHPGARMLITRKGLYIGRLSAGCVEEEIADHAQAVIGDGKPSVWSFDLRSRFACDGSIDVFVERLVKPNAFLEGLIGVITKRRPILASTNYRLTDAAPGTRITDFVAAGHDEEFLQEIPPRSV